MKKFLKILKNIYFYYLNKNKLFSFKLIIGKVPYNKGFITKLGKNITVKNNFLFLNIKDISNLEITDYYENNIKLYNYEKLIVLNYLFSKPLAVYNYSTGMLGIKNKN